jgi:hypothetical protein
MQLMEDRAQGSSPASSLSNEALLLAAQETKYKGNK